MLSAKLGRKTKTWLHALLADASEHRLARHWRSDLHQSASRPRPLSDADLPPGPVLVLAAHVDDEILGAGLALIGHAAKGDQVAVCYLTDSSASHHPHWTPEQLAARRREEAADLAQEMGWRTPEFANVQDGHLFNHLDDAATVVARILTSYRPLTFYLPAILDAHPDHVAVAQVLDKALDLAGISATNHEVMAMQLHTPFGLSLANAWVEAGSRWPLKPELLSRFTSQTMSFANFLAVQKSLSAVTCSRTPAELFIRMPAAGYLRACGDALQGHAALGPLRSLSGYWDLLAAVSDAETARQAWHAALKRYGWNVG